MAYFCFHTRMTMNYDIKSSWETCYFWSVSCYYSMLASSAVDRGFEPWSTQTKDFLIVICFFSAKHASLRRKSKEKDWLARKQDNIFEWGDMSKNPTKHDFIIISLKINLFSPWYSWKIVELALNNNHSLTIIFSNKNKYFLFDISLT